MTREETINIVQGARQYLTAGNPIWDAKKIDEAMKMAIEALQDEAVQSCDGCIYNTRIPQEQCLRCKRYWIDSYERKGGGEK